ncbi:MAG TPA: hypothetical protein VJM10_03920 [Candidatus Methylomirabilis sp.]|nr:hypothetical protein [Candidatus Methylomirabilis sp.]
MRRLSQLDEQAPNVGIMNNLDRGASAVLHTPGKYTTSDGESYVVDLDHDELAEFMASSLTRDGLDAKADGGKVIVAADTADRKATTVDRWADQMEKSR